MKNINHRHGKLIEIQIDKMNQSLKINPDTFEVIRHQLDMVSKSVGEFHNQLLKDVNRIALRNFQNVNLSIIQTYQNQVERLNSMFREFPIQRFEIEIPRSLHPHVGSLASMVNEVIDTNDQESLPNIAEDLSRPDAVTWGQLKEYISFVLAIISIFYAVYANHQSTQQLEDIEQSQQIIIKQNEKILEQNVIQRNEKIIEQLENVLDEVEPHISKSERMPVDVNSTEECPDKPE